MIQGINVTQITASSYTDGRWLATDDRILFWAILEGSTKKARMYDVAEDGTLSLADEYEYSGSLPTQAAAVGSSESHDWFVLFSSGSEYLDGVFTNVFKMCFIGVHKATGNLAGLGGENWDTIDIKIADPFEENPDPPYESHTISRVAWSPAESTLFVLCPGRKYAYDDVFRDTARLGVLKMFWNPQTAIAGSLEAVSSFDLFEMDNNNTPSMQADPIQLANGDLIAQLVNQQGPSYLLRLDGATGVVLEVRKTDDSTAISKFSNLKTLPGNSFMLTSMSIPTTPEYRLFSENQHLVSYNAVARTYEWDDWNYLKKDEVALPIFHPRSDNRIPPTSLHYGYELIDPLEVTGSETAGQMIQYITEDFKGSWVPHLGIPVARLFWWDWQVDHDLKITLSSANWISLEGELSETPDKHMTAASRWYDRGRPKGYLITTYNAPDYDLVDVVLIDPEQLNV